jgi:hypothetical protein
MVAKTILKPVMVAASCPGINLLKKLATNVEVCSLNISTKLVRKNFIA